MTAAKVKKGGTNRLALCFLPRPLLKSQYLFSDFDQSFFPADLNESSEWRESGAGANHDDRSAGSVGQPELRPPDIDRHPGELLLLLSVPGGGRHLVPQPGGGHAVVSPPGASLVLHNNAADVDTGGVNLTFEFNIILHFLNIVRLTLALLAIE